MNKTKTNNQIKIMPCLDMRNGRVVKGVRFIDIRELKKYLRDNGVNVSL